MEDLPPTTAQARLLAAAKALFWTRGYSNVGLREIARAAEADVALVSRYYGSKRGLFEATLEGVPAVADFGAETPDALVDALVEMCRPGQAYDDANALTLALANAGDPEVGATLRQHYRSHWHAPLAALFGNDRAAARVGAVLWGHAMMVKTMKAPGFAPEAHDEDLRALLRAALDRP